MKIISDVSLRDKGVSPNFFQKRGVDIPTGTFENHHVKVLSEEKSKEISKSLSQILHMKVEAFLIVNIGNVFIYIPDMKAIYLYFPEYMKAERVENLERNNLDWFLNTYLANSEVIRYIFNSDLFELALKDNEILYLPIDAKNEQAESYRPVDMEVYFELHRQDVLGE